MQMLQKVDVTIIGAGVVGLATGASIKPKHGGLILEKNGKYGRETSSRNSEVDHSGIYYPMGSLKAKLCVRGNELGHELFEKNGIPHAWIGKNIVATTKEEYEKLGQLHINGIWNGVQGLRMLSQRELAELEPNVKAIGALFSPNTGIVSAHGLMDYFYSKACGTGGNGFEFVPNTEVVAIEQGSDGYKITVKSGDERFSFLSAVVINSAGLGAEKINRMLGLQDESLTLHYCKGEYFSLSSSAAKLVNGLVYPVPGAIGLGVHVTKDLGGGARLGPNAFFIDEPKPGEEFDYSVDPAHLKGFLEGAQKFLPMLLESDLAPAFAGIRPKLSGPEGGFRDFVVEEPLPGYFNITGMDSPGLTAAGAIGEYLRPMVEGLL